MCEPDSARRIPSPPVPSPSLHPTIHPNPIRKTRSSAFALFALVAAACGGRGECCAFPDDISAQVVDEDGLPVPDALVVFERPGGQPVWASSADTTCEGPQATRLRTDSTGMAIHHAPDSAYYRVSVTPPAGFALADSARASETVFHFRTTNQVRFVLKRVP